MKHPLTGMALLAALTIAAPAFAQDATGTTQHPHAAAHHATHHKMASHPQGRASQASEGDIANQLNRQELSRDQAGNVPSPPPSSPFATTPSARMPRGSSTSSRTPGPKTSAGAYIQPQPGAGTAPPQPSPTGIGATQGGPR
jgi:hypothetical protein